MEILYQPRYLNYAKVIPLDFSIDEWYEIPTFYDPRTGGAQISVLQVIPLKNFQVDLLYDGDIQNVDERTLSSSEINSYPTQNPIFHSEFLYQMTEGHYRFQTSYPSVKFNPGRLSEAVKLTKPDTNIKQRQNEVNPELLRRIVGGEDDLELILDNLCQFVKDSISGTSNKNNWYDFLARYKELESTGQFSGNCREVSTITAGLLNALGLKSKILSSTILEKVDGKYEYRSLHSFTEVFVPVDKETGFWLLIDPSTGLTYNSEQQHQEKYAYLFNSVELPIFSDSTKSAKIRIKYI
jgi:transglutaminase-like putative cysteine protease